MEDESRAIPEKIPADACVLVVDVDPVALTVVSKMLRTWGYKVVTAKEATDAVNILAESNDEIDVILADAHLPDTDKYQFLESIRAHFNLPTILMSADDNEGAMLGCLFKGAEFYLVKPITMNNLKTHWQFAYIRKRGRSRDKKRSSLRGEPPDGIKARKKCPLEMTDEDYDSDDSQPAKRSKLNWSRELHERFLRAVRILGLDRAQPKKILQCMNVPGLTKDHVSSHLQKYRQALRRERETIEKTWNGGFSSEKHAIYYPSSTYNLQGDSPEFPKMDASMTPEFRSPHQNSRSTPEFKSPHQNSRSTPKFKSPYQHNLSNPSATPTSGLSYSSNPSIYSGGNNTLPATYNQPYQNNLSNSQAMSASGSGHSSNPPIYSGGNNALPSMAMPSFDFDHSSNSYDQPQQNNLNLSNSIATPSSSFGQPSNSYDQPQQNKLNLSNPIATPSSGFGQPSDFSNPKATPSFDFSHSSNSHDQPYQNNLSNPMTIPSFGFDPSSNSHDLPNQNNLSNPMATLSSGFVQSSNSNDQSNNQSTSQLLSAYVSQNNSGITSAQVREMTSFQHMTDNVSEDTFWKRLDIFAMANFSGFQNGTNFPTSSNNITQLPPPPPQPPTTTLELPVNASFDAENFPGFQNESYLPTSSNNITHLPPPPPTLPPQAPTTTLELPGNASFGTENFPGFPNGSYLSTSSNNITPPPPPPSTTLELLGNSSFGAENSSGFENGSYLPTSSNNIIHPPPPPQLPPPQPPTTNLEPLGNASFGAGIFLGFENGSYLPTSSNNITQPPTPPPPPQPPTTTLEPQGNASFGVGNFPGIENGSYLPTSSDNIIQPPPPQPPTTTLDPPGNASFGTGGGGGETDEQLAMENEFNQLLEGFMNSGREEPMNVNGLYQLFYVEGENLDSINWEFNSV